MKKLQQEGRKRFKRILQPFQQFVQAETFSGILLLFFTLLALIWTNSPFSESYFSLWHTKLSLGFGDFLMDESLHFWINDGLMAIFFFLVGLEIKREILAGELSSARLAVLPVIAAVGGMLFPALIYLIFNFGTPSAHGWGIPTATDIAFAIGIMSLVGKKVPLGLKVFLAALAIADDMGAVVIIAIFYSSGISLGWLIAAAAFFTLQVLMNRLNVHKNSVYAILGIGLWFALWKTGVHPTIAGVLSAIAIPARTKLMNGNFTDWARHYLTEYDRAPKTPATPLVTQEEQEALLGLATISENAQTPLQRIEHKLQPWVSYLIMPLFALANAGVIVGSELSQAYSMPSTIGVMLGLFLGKPLGITFFSFLAVKSRLASLPAGANWVSMLGTGAVAGIGFTMSIFIANLAFGSESPFLSFAKIGILSASVLSGLVGWLILRGSR
ncbi:MAG: Na+/H+ antiporter NhaA [Ignavibacteria bacterium]|nr:Na+/H+ antiporter NhaA [Ignavibacteria bacterium]MCU7501880.1 Na+/H+ antiporter NhaA [Ignavibacteria bacterium]MCU7514774.1 Na+/H+ antiporter NhaA [Ignavibacteria bacterium]